MKKILLLAFICFAGLIVRAQVADSLFGNRLLIVNNGGLSIAGTNRSDSVWSASKLRVKYFKPLILSTYTFTGLPTASSFTGALVYASDTAAPYYSNGTSWQKIGGGGGGGGGGSQSFQQVLSTGSTMTGNNTVSLAGYSFNFSAGSRGRSLLINPADSFVHLQNFGHKYEPDSLSTVTNNYYPIYIKSSSLHGLSADYSMGRSFLLQAGGAPLESTSFGDNLKGNGAQINTSLSSLGIYQQYNLYASTVYHNVFELRSISTAGVSTALFKTDVMPASITTNVTANSFSYNNPSLINTTAAYPQHFILTPNLTLLQGSAPTLRFKDTSYPTQTSAFVQNGPDFQMNSGRNLSISAGGNGLTFVGGYIYFNSATNGMHQGAPTAQLHIGAGSSSAQTAPLKFTSGTLMTTPEAGAVEFDGTHYYGTVGTTRYQLDQQSGGAGLSYTWASSLNTADYTIAASNAIKLVDLTGQANHNIVLPSSPTGNQVLLIVRNINSSGFTWTFTGGAVKDAGNNTVTALANNTTYQLSWDGTTYVIIN